MDSIIKKDKENNSFMLEVILLKWSIIFLLYLGANVVQVTGMIKYYSQYRNFAKFFFCYFCFVTSFLVFYKKRNQAKKARFN